MHLYLYFSCIIFYLSDVSVLLKNKCLSIRFILFQYIYILQTSFYFKQLFIIIKFATIKFVHFLKYFRYFDLSKESSNSSTILTFCFGLRPSILRLRSSSLIEFMSKGNFQQNINM